MCYTREQIERAVKSKNYVWFEDTENKGFDVNIVGVRNSSTGKKVTNLFDDCLTISYKENDNPKGVARLVPNQYRSVWSVDKHQNKYDALCQRNGDVTVWRDKNKDLTFDEVDTQTGSFGINIHKSGQDSTWVENWSMGCQVFKRVMDFDIFMSICKKASKIHGNKFSYTLLESKDII